MTVFCTQACRRRRPSCSSAACAGSAACRPSCSSAAATSCSCSRPRGAGCSCSAPPSGGSPSPVLQPPLPAPVSSLHLHLVDDRAEVAGLREASHVERVQEQTLTVLLEQQEQQQQRAHQDSGSGCQGHQRLARLLLLLGSLRAVPAQLLEEAFFRSTIGPVPIERILCDVLQTL
uniref:Putative nuclear receptor n=1 Tax=Ixodes ricinus TaxID=34613 RepID=A0A147BAQ5_IXORI